jgi:hypothetical protein
MTWWGIVTGMALGIGLSAACGFRVFAPVLIVSGAALAGGLGLGEGFRWLATWPAFAALAVTTLVEIAAYHVPWLDHALDMLATPAAVLAGTLLTAAQLGELDPLVQWSLALIAGGGAAGVIQGATTALRGVSTAATGGLLNPLLASAELAGSVVTTIGTLLLPLLGLCVLLGVVLVGCLLWVQQRKRRHPPTPFTRPT